MPENSEKKVLKNWLEEAKQGHKRMSELIDGYNDNGYKQYDVDRAWNRVKPEPIQRVIWMKRAAVFLVLVVSTFCVLNNLKNEDKTNIEYALFRDGSEYKIFGDAELNYQSNEKREVSLEGRTFFKVKKDESRPFVVKTKNFEVEVLGTEFVVNASGLQEYVWVKEGRVQVTKSGERIILGANQYLDLSKGEFLLKELNSTHQLDSWIKGELILENRKIEEALIEIAHHTGTQIDFVAGMDFGSCRFNSVITNESIQLILKEMEALFDIDYTIENNHVTLTRFECH